MSQMGLTPPAAAALALNATFCLCPTGDARGFTARFYFSLALGCIPVRLDGWNRTAPVTFPYADRIAWDKIVVHVPTTAHGIHTLLARLADMSAAEIVDRRRELRRVAGMLTYSELDPLESTHVKSSQVGSIQVTSSHLVEDAATAAVAELQRRVLGGTSGADRQSKAHTAGPYSGAYAAVEAARAQGLHHRDALERASAVSSGVRLRTGARRADAEDDNVCPHESEMSADPTVSYMTVLNRLARG